MLVSLLLIQQLQLLFLISFPFLLWNWSPVEACYQNLIPLYDEGNLRYVSCNLWNTAEKCPVRASCQLASRAWVHTIGLDSHIVHYLCCVNSSIQEPVINTKQDRTEYLLKKVAEIPRTTISPFPTPPFLIDKQKGPKISPPDPADWFGGYMPPPTGTRGGPNPSPLPRPVPRPLPRPRLPPVPPPVPRPPLFPGTKKPYPKPPKIFPKLPNPPDFPFTEPEKPRPKLPAPPTFPVNKPEKPRLPEPPSFPITQPERPKPVLPPAPVLPKMPKPPLFPPQWQPRQPPVPEPPPFIFPPEQYPPPPTPPPIEKIEPSEAPYTFPQPSPFPFFQPPTEPPFPSAPTFPPIKSITDPPPAPQPPTEEPALPPTPLPVPAAPSPPPNPQPPTFAPPTPPGTIVPPRTPSNLPGTAPVTYPTETRLSPLLFGDVTNRSSDGLYRYTGSVTLVQDDGFNILVDSGSAVGRMFLIAALAAKNLTPQNVHILLITHGHPDHVGNENVFPNAEKLFASALFKGDEYMEPDVLKEPVIRLTKNVEVWKTPGHTLQHNSIIVRNATGLGTVAVSGDLFMSREDFSNPGLWRDRAVDANLQELSRNLIICQVEKVLPGHGLMFQVTPELRQRANCGRRKIRNHKLFARVRSIE